MKSWSKHFDVTCIDEERAGAFSNWLYAQGVDCTFAGQVVTVPYGGSIGFLMEIYQAAVGLGFADDATASDEMCALLP